MAGLLAVGDDHRFDAPPPSPVPPWFTPAIDRPAGFLGRPP
jgi:hypothetical protein